MDRHPLMIALVAALALGGAAWSWQWSGRADLGTSRWQNVWFDADHDMVYADLTNLQQRHRTHKHPLFFLTQYPIVKTISVVTGKQAAVRIWLAAGAALWIGMLALVLAASGRPLIDVAIFSGLFAVSATYLYSVPFPETYIVGSITMLAALWLTTRPRVSLGAALAANVATLGITVTNWMAGLALAVTRLSRRRAALVAGLALAVVATIAVGQGRVLSTTGAFMQPQHVQAELSYMTGGSPSERLPMLALWSVVAKPARVYQTPPDAGGKPGLTMQETTADRLRRIVALGWLALVLMGVWSLARTRSAFAMGLLAVVGGQILLHALYGYETFLFTPHVTPLLVLVAAHATAARPRLTRTLAALVLAGCAIVNLPSFARAFDLALPLTSR